MASVLCRMMAWAVLGVRFLLLSSEDRMPLSKVRRIRELVVDGCNVCGFLEDRFAGAGLIAMPIFSS